MKKPVYTVCTILFVFAQKTDKFWSVGKGMRTFIDGAAHVYSHIQIYAIWDVNHLQMVWFPSGPHHIELLRCASVDSMNDLRHMLQTCSCIAQSRSDHCWSIKMSIILCILSVDNSFAVSVASAANRHILCYLNKILLNSMHIGSATYVTHAHTFAAISRLAPHHLAQCKSVHAQVCSWLKINYILFSEGSASSTMNFRVELFSSLKNQQHFQPSRDSLALQSYQKLSIVIDTFHLPITNYNFLRYR